MKLLVKYFSQIFLLISVFILIYTFYRSEIYYETLAREFYLKYYLISFVLILLSLISFKLNSEIKKYSIILIVSFIFTLYLFETYITIVKDGVTLKDRKIKIYEKNTKLKYDQRSKAQVYKDLIQKEKNITMHVSAHSYKNSPNKYLHPLSGISNVDTIFCNENGYYSIYKSDRYGFNNPNTEWENNEYIKYLLVGDSFTHGACVNRPDDIGSVLRTISKNKVLNLGWGGNGPLIQYATLREYLTPNVQNIIWIYFEGNDLFDLRNELDIPILKKYIDDLNFTQNLKNKQKEINAIGESIIKKELEKAENNHYSSEENTNSNLFKIKKFIKLVNSRAVLLKLAKIDSFKFGIKRAEAIPEFKSDKKTPLFPEFKKILKLSKNLADNNNSNFYFVYLPDLSYDKNSFYKDYNLSLNKKYFEIKLLLDELNIPLIDIRYIFLKKVDDYRKFIPFELSGHLNANGYKRIAEIIYKELK